MAPVWSLELASAPPVLIWTPTRASQVLHHILGQNIRGRFPADENERQRWRERHLRWVVVGKLCPDPVSSLLQCAFVEGVVWFALMYSTATLTALADRVSNIVFGTDASKPWTPEMVQLPSGCFFLSHLPLAIGLKRHLLCCDDEAWQACLVAVFNVRVITSPFVYAENTRPDSDHHNQNH